MSKCSKSQKLGMSFVTARYRLDRDLLFKFATQLGHKCHRCGGELTRDTFSVDHIENWSKSDSPVEAFFDLDNIAFSHVHCNSKEMYDRVRKYENKEERRKANNNRRVYDPVERRTRYLRLGT